MFITKENLKEVKVGGWVYPCCHKDLQILDAELLQEITEDIEEDDYWMGYRYHENKIEALTEIFATWCRSHMGKGSHCDCESAIKEVYSMICDELHLPKT